MPCGIGTNIFVHKNVFFQKVNGVEYALKNEEYNPMGIIGIG
jgi:hypothetical protein